MVLYTLNVRLAAVELAKTCTMFNQILAITNAHQVANVHKVPSLTTMYVYDQRTVLVRIKISGIMHKMLSKSTAIIGEWQTKNVLSLESLIQLYTS